MTAISFRFAGLEDAAAIVALVERAYRGEASAATWTSEAHLLRGPRTSRGEIEAMLADPQSRIVLAEENRVRVGCALIQERAASPCHPSSTPAGEAYFGLFAVSPDAQAGGLGKAILAECEGQARALWGSNAMVMTVINLRTALIAWYERRGYVRTGAREPFPFTATTGEVTRDFDLLVLRKLL